MIKKYLLYTSKSYFLWQLPYVNIQNPCKVVKILSNWGKNSPFQSFNGKSCYSPAISISAHGINSTPQIFIGKSCYYPAISTSAHGINSPPQFFNGKSCYYPAFSIITQGKKIWCHLLLRIIFFSIKIGHFICFFNNFI